MKIRTLLTIGIAIAGTGSAWSQSDTLSARRVIKRYYVAIEQHDYRTAYSFWKGNGEGSPKSLAAFTTGFHQTAHTSVTLFRTGRLEAAAGSVYITIPVAVKAQLKDGKQQRFTGAYTLRRINGPVTAKNAWHIYSAKLKLVL